MDNPIQIAFAGGPATFPDGPPGWPLVDDDVRDALLRAYEDGSWGKYHGRHTTSLISDLQDMHGVEGVLLCSSGTIGVELALRGVGVESGDQVVLAGYDFPGNFRAIEAIGARPVLVDIDSDTWCLDACELQRLLEARRSTQPSGRLRAVVVSHLHGGLATMRQIMELARAHQLAVVEDACQAPGAKIDGQPAGTLGDVGVLSFGGSKLLSAGRGGALLTRDPSILQRAKVFAERGNSAFPLSQLQAAVLCPQVAKLEHRNAVRAERAGLLAKLLAPLDSLGTLPMPADLIRAFYKFAIRYQPSPQGASRQELIWALQAEGLAIDEGFRGFAQRTARRCDKFGELAASRHAAETTLLLHHPVLLETEAVIRRVASALEKVLQRLAGNTSHLGKGAGNPRASATRPLGDLPDSLRPSG